MIAKGNLHKNGVKAARYVLRKGDNDVAPEILFIRGTSQPDDLMKSVLEMEYPKALTKTDAGLFHEQLCPQKHESLNLSKEQWQEIAGFYLEKMGWDKQKCAGVLHTKNSQRHLHLLVGRYDAQTGNMLDNAFTRLRRNKARMAVQERFGLVMTPENSLYGPQVQKEAMSAWMVTKTGTDFIGALKKKNLTVSRGDGKRPFEIIDSEGRVFDLTRKLKDRDTKTYIQAKEVYKRLEEVELPSSSDILKPIRQRQQAELNLKSAATQSLQDITQREQEKAREIQERFEAIRSRNKGRDYER